MTTILGISAFYHDSAAAMIVDGRIVAAAQEERFSRIKHDASFPSQAIEFCLEQAGVKVDDLDYVAFYEKPFLKFERLLETYLACAPTGFQSFRTSMPIWLKSKLYISRLIRKGLGKQFRRRIVFPEHHESHAASAFFASPFERSAIMTVDGVGEWATTTIGVGRGNKIELTRELIFPDSLGLLYAAFTYFCGFRVNGGEGKLMGLAPFGKPVYVDSIFEHLIDLKDDGSFRMNQKYFDYMVGDTMASREFAQLFGGPPRIPESTITQREKDLAASIQSVTESILLRMANHLHRETGESNLCIAGGVALNCVANGMLLRESPFENVWVQPAAGDSGGAIGAALFVWHQLLQQERDPKTGHSYYLGPLYSEDSVESTLSRLNAQFHSMGDEQLMSDVVDLLTKGKIVGWFRGRMEFGPRALGNRSILAEPRSPEVPDQLNQKIKFRESFRPFAPMVLANRANEHFEIAHDSPHMLFACLVRPREDESAIPAVTHVDGSARVQTVSQTDNLSIHNLLKTFDQATGCPVLVNTSFNVRGEPIVCSPEDAYRCFMKSEMDAVVIENCLLLKTEQPPWRFSESSKQPTLGVRIYQNWMRLTFPIRWLVANLTLFLIYALVITPVGAIWQKMNRDTFQQIDGDASSYWRKRRTQSPPSRYFKQF